MVGHVFMGRYQVLRLLGEGGMGQVYLARHQNTNRQVVVKVMRGELAADPKVRETFQREMEFMAKFHHPFAVQLIDGSFGEKMGPCIIMEYIPGVTLEDLLAKQKRLGIPRVGKMLGQLCQALQAAASIGLVHQDLKPANIMIMDPDTPKEKVKVMDFGLAKLTAKPHIPLEKLTNSSADLRCGTPDYISPEMVRGDEVDHRGDIYSVGVILYEMLTGFRPFDHENFRKVMEYHVSKPPPKFAEIGADKWLSEDIEKVVLRCLSKFPNERPQSSLEVAQLFEKAVGQKFLDPEGNVMPAPDVARTPTPPKPVDPNAIKLQLEAWMPEKIAVVKLRGFVQDMGGEIIQSIPGLIQVFIPTPKAPKSQSPGLLQWLGIGKKPEVVVTEGGIDMELHMEKKESSHQNLLQLTVLLRPHSRRSAADPAYRERCDRILRELRAYLIGSMQ